MSFHDFKCRPNLQNPFSSSPYLQLRILCIPSTKEAPLRRRCAVPTRLFTLFAPTPGFKWKTVRTSAENQRDSLVEQTKCRHQRKVTTIPRFCHDCEACLGVPTPLTEDFVWAFWLYKAKNLMTSAIDACLLSRAAIQQVNRKEIEEAKNHFYGVLELGSRDWNISMEE